MSRENDFSCSGYCRDCEREHSLPEGNARIYALKLMREFERIQRLDYLTSKASADPALSFDRIFAGEQGNMFGVLECQDEHGATRVLRAFSSLPRGIREVEGWVPPILSSDTYYGLVEPTRKRIERLSAELERIPIDEKAHQARAAQRRKISQNLFEEMQQRYRFHNFRGGSRPLRKALSNDSPVPGGVGECCAPKLLDYAARYGLRPLGLAEFYWCGENSSRHRRRGQFFPVCESRCRPLLGFLLCGLDDDDCRRS
ncbi:hypothetical protein MK489_14515 [Myxococcota bacterium]|nr:hypothetical protein [Myxococcota bacterium]